MSRFLFMHKIVRNQQGVTLLLAILILSAVTAISFSLSTILLIELRSSNDLSHTEPAWYATQAQTEEYLFQLRRRVNLAGFPFTTSLNGITLNGATSPVGDPIQQDVVKAGSNSFAATRNRYLLFDPANGPYTGGSGYSKVEVSYLNTAVGGQIHVYICQYNPSAAYDCSNPAALYYQDPAPLSEGGSTGEINIDPTKQQELIVYSTGPSADRYILLKSWDSAGNPRGMPYFGVTAVNISGSGPVITRSVRIKVPNANPITNIAQGRTATQSSSPYSAGTPSGTADKAVDGNTDGLWANGSVTHTGTVANEWWQVDLGVSPNIDSLTVWNRTDPGVGSRLSDYWVFISDTPFNPGDTPATLSVRAGTWSTHQTTMPNPYTYISAGGAKGRYVRIQQGGANYLSLAEVQIYGR